MSETQTQSKYSPELEAILEEALEVLDKEDTVLLLFDDMFDINEHFQATLDWFKDRGNKMRRRFGQGAYMQRGMAYFVGADTHIVPTRGVVKELDLRPWSEELVREVGLEARLKKKGMV